MKYIIFCVIVLLGCLTLPRSSSDPAANKRIEKLEETNKKLETRIKNLESRKK